MLIALFHKQEKGQLSGKRVHAKLFLKKFLTREVIMFLIITKENQRYTVEKVKHQANGIVFEYNNELVFIENNKIKEIDANYKMANAKNYRNK